jgi:hypothetical protein
MGIWGVVAGDAADGCGVSAGVVGVGDADVTGGMVETGDAEGLVGVDDGGRLDLSVGVLIFDCVLRDGSSQPVGQRTDIMRTIA